MTNSKHDFSHVHAAFEDLINGILLISAKQGKSDKALSVIEQFKKEIEIPFEKVYDFMEELRNGK